MRCAAVMLLFLAACKDKPAGPPTSRQDSDVRPAFDGAPRAVDAKVAAYCEALHQMPAERKAACCKAATQVHFGGECARVLSLALEQGTVTLSGSEACVRDLVASHQACGWVGPNEVPLPGSCSGVVRGTIAAGKKCRSTLECVAGSRCLGAGPTAAGVCSPPGDDGMACELSVDVLASYTRAALPAHLECAGVCQRHRCESVLTDGGACTLDAQCPDGQRCAGACVPGTRGEAGEKCVPGGCADGLRCVSGVCAAPKAEGADCAADLECAGACVKGKCGAGC